jgi:hypothetical protein
LEPVALSDWRLVGPRLATLIVALPLRFRLSRRRMREFPHDWLGLSLSVCILNRTLREAAAATAPLEPALIAAVVVSDLLPVDETSWPPGGRLAVAVGLRQWVIRQCALAGVARSGVETRSTEAILGDWDRMLLGLIDAEDTRSTAAGAWWSF